MRRELSGAQQISFRNGYNLLLKCEFPVDCRGVQKKVPYEHDARLVAGMRWAHATNRCRIADKISFLFGDS